MPRFTDRLPRTTQLKLGAAALLAIGVAGGAGAVSLTRPSIEMAPTTPTAIARLASTEGIVTIKGRVAEVFGDRFVLQDGTGRTMIDGGRNARVVSRGGVMTVQGRYADGQVRASYLIDPAGHIDAVGPAGARPPHHPEGPAGPGRDGPDGGPPRPPRGGPADQGLRDRGPGDRGPALAAVQPGCAPVANGPLPSPGNRQTAPSAQPVPVQPTDNAG